MARETSQTTEPLKRCPHCHEGVLRHMHLPDVTPHEQLVCDRFGCLHRQPTYSGREEA